MQAEFAAYLDVQPYYWEDEPMWGQQDYQTSIPDPGQFDVFLCFLGSRLGMPLNPAHHSRADGSVYRSGTVYELEQALNAYHTSGGEPQLLIYHRKSMPPIPNSLEEANKAIQNALEMQNLIHEWQRDSTYGTYFSQAINSYESIEVFEFKLEKAIREDLRSRVPDTLPLPLATTWLHGSPFRGLRYFDFQHSPIFYGRTRAIGDIFASLKNQDAAGSPFVLIGGSSGVGKSSLVRAGLLPMLFGSPAEFGAGSWRYAVLSPADVRKEGDDLNAVLVRALARDATPDVRSARDVKAMPQPPKALPEILAATTPAALTHMAQNDLPCFTGQIIATLNQISVSLGSPVRLCLFIDQLEELFTLGWITPDIRERFFVAIKGLVTSGRVVVLATMRADFLLHCESVPTLMELKQKEGYYHLQAPTSNEIERMIRLPAQAAGLHFEEDAQGRSLDTLLLEDMNHGVAALPMLEFTLQCLYERIIQRKEVANCDARLRIEDYESLGKLEGAIATKAQETFESLSQEGQSAFAEVIRLCVTQPQNSPPVRREALTESVEAIAGGQEFAEAFINARLLVAATRESSCDARPVRVLSLAHEALLGHWQKLSDLLKQDQKFLLVRNQVENLASVWESERAQDGKPHDELLMADGSLLFSAEEALKQHPQQFSSIVTDFITRSTRARDKAKRRMWLWVAILLTLLALSSCAGGFAAYQWYQAEAAKSLAEQQTQRAEKANQAALRYMDTLVSDVCEQLRRADNWPLLTKIYNAMELYFIENPPSADRFEQRLYAKFLVEYNYLKWKEKPVDIPFVVKNYEKALAIWEEEEKFASDPNVLVGYIQERANILSKIAQFTNYIIKDSARAISMMEQSAALSAKAYELSKNEYYKTVMHYPLLHIVDCHIGEGKYDEAINFCKEVYSTLTANKEQLTSIERSTLNLYLLKILEVYDKDKKKYADDILKYANECLENVQILLNAKMNDYDLHFGFARANIYIHEALDTKKDSSAAKYLETAIEKLTTLSTSFPGNTGYRSWLDYSIEHRKTCGLSRDTKNKSIADTLYNAGRIEDAIPFYKEQAHLDHRFAQENRENLKAWQYHTESLSTLGKILIDAGDAKAALEQYIDIERILREQLAATPQQSQLKKTLADCLENMAQAQNTLGMLPDALKSQQAALDARIRFLQLAPNDVTAQEDIWESMYILSNLHLQNGDHQAAIALLRERLRVNEALLAADPKNENLHLRVSRYLDQLANAELQIGDTENAQKHYMESLQIDEELMEQDKNNANNQINLAISLARMAKVHADQKNIDKALQFQEESVNISRRLADINPSSASLQESLYSRLRYLVELMSDREGFRDKEKAINAAKEALEIRRRLAGINPDTPDEWLNLASDLTFAGYVCEKAGNELAALDYFTQASQVVEKAVNKVPNNLRYMQFLVHTKNLTSDVCFNIKNWDRFISTELEKVKILASMARLEPDNTEHSGKQAMIHHNIGIAKYITNDVNGAIKSMQNCTNIIYDIHKNNPNNSELHAKISSLLFEAAEFMFWSLNSPAAESCINDSLSWLRSVIAINPDNDSLKSTLQSQLFRAIQIERNLENQEAVLALLKEQVQLNRDTVAQYPGESEMQEQLYTNYFDLASTLLDMGKPGEAIVLCDEIYSHAQSTLLANTKDEQLQKNMTQAMAFALKYKGNAYAAIGSNDSAAEQFKLCITACRNRLNQYPKEVNVQLILTYTLKDLYAIKPPRSRKQSIALLKEALNLALKVPKRAILLGEKSLSDHISALQKEIKNLQSRSKDK